MELLVVANLFLNGITRSPFLVKVKVEHVNSVCHIPRSIYPKFENFGDRSRVYYNCMFLVVSSPSPPPPFPQHANACTDHNFVTNTPIKFIFAIAIEVPDYKNPMIFGINWKNKMATGGHFV